MGYSSDSNDISIEAEESLLIEAVARKRLAKSVQTGEDLVFATVNYKLRRLAVTL